MVAGSIASEKVASVLAVAAHVRRSLGRRDTAYRGRHGVRVAQVHNVVPVVAVPVSSEASTGSPVALLTFCFVEVALLMRVSVALWMKGVPNPSEKEILERDVFL